MTKKEFEDRIGREATDDEYVMADAAYLACGDSADKDLFCELYKDEPLQLVDMLADRVRTMEAEVAAMRQRMKEAGKAFLALHGVSDEDRGIAVKLLGEHDYLRIKLEKDYYLTKSDREALISKL